MQNLHPVNESFDDEIRSRMEKFRVPYNLNAIDVILLQVLVPVEKLLGNREQVSGACRGNCGGGSKIKFRGFTVAGRRLRLVLRIISRVANFGLV